MTIRKGVVTFTFLFDDTINSVDDVNAMSLEDIMYHCTHEHMVGMESFGDHNITPVPDDCVESEEIAMGCDGTFFADPDELEHARLDALGEEDDERPDRPCDPSCARREHPAAECNCSRSR